MLHAVIAIVTGCHGRSRPSSKLNHCQRSGLRGHSHWTIYRVSYNGKLLTHLSWVGCHKVSQLVHLSIQTRLLCLQFDNSMFTKLCFQIPRMCICMLCRLQYALIWFLCFSIDNWYCCLSRRSIMQLSEWRSTQCLDYQMFITWNI